MHIECGKPISLLNLVALFEQCNWLNIFIPIVSIEFHQGIEDGYHHAWGSFGTVSLSSICQAKEPTISGQWRNMQGESGICIGTRGKCATIEEGIGKALDAWNRGGVTTLSLWCHIRERSDITPSANDRLWPQPPGTRIVDCFNWRPKMSTDWREGSQQMIFEHPLYFRYGVA